VSNTTSIESEIWLHARAREHGATGPDPFSGVTDTAGRCRAMRALLLSNGLSSIVCGSRQGKCETYAQTFERLYGEPLDDSKPAAPRAPKKRRVKRDA